MVSPGKRAWPFHAHQANEELFFILEGCGTLRLGASRYPLRVGDCIPAPAGGPDSAQQIINDSPDDLKYLCISTQCEPDVMFYPDSGKFAVFAGAAPGGDKAARTFSYCGRLSDAVDYWTDEPGA